MLKHKDNEYSSMTDYEISNLDNNIEKSIAYIIKYGVNAKYPNDEEIKEYVVKQLKQLDKLIDDKNK